ncbi:uncharacterized protein LOC144139666 [Haemaphysalis longicornis]
MTAHVDNRGIPDSPLRSPHSPLSSPSSPSSPSRPKKVIRVARSEDAARVARASSAAAVAPLKVQHKQAHTHSARDLSELDSSEEEGRIVSSKFVTPSVSPLPRWRSYLFRSLTPDFSKEALEKAMPVVALSMAFGAFLYAAMILSNPRPPSVR